MQGKPCSCPNRVSDFTLLSIKRYKLFLPGTKAFVDCMIDGQLTPVLKCVAHLHQRYELLKEIQYLTFSSSNLREGLWSPDKDQKLRDVINYGHGCWSSVPINAGLQRNGKSCRLRWINYLRPGLKRGSFTSQEEETVLTLHSLLGNKWSLISQHLPGRTDNEVKNHWHSYLKKRVAKLESLEAQQPEYTNLNTGNTELSSSYMNSITRNTSFNSSDFSNHSCVGTNQPVPQAQINKLPKILFADWLSLEEFNGRENLECKDGLSNNSNYQGTPAHGLLSNEASTDNSETVNCESNHPNEDMFHTQMKIDQIFNFSGEDFNIEDFLYM